MKSPGERATKTILVVDDNDDVRAIAVSILETLGYDVEEARSGREAIALLEAHKYIALLLSDVVMPGMNGFELVRRARQLRPDIKVVLVTGHPGVQTKVGMLDDDVHILFKPYRAADLVREVRHAFETRH